MGLEDRVGMLVHVGDGIDISDDHELVIDNIKQSCLAAVCLIKRRGYDVCGGVRVLPQCDQVEHVEHLADTLWLEVEREIFDCVGVEVAFDPKLVGGKRLVLGAVDVVAVRKSYRR